MSNVEDPSCLDPDQTIDIASMDSFPASDSPPWGATHAGTPAVAAAGPLMFHDAVQRLRDDVRLLSETIGERNDGSREARRNLALAADAIEGRFRDANVPVKRRNVNDPAPSIEAVLRGGELAATSVVIGAHYDSPRGSPGAADNASGVAVLFALARAFQEISLARTVRLVAFPASQPSRASSRGSARYLAELQREGPKVVSMLSLECLGVTMTELPWPLRLVPMFRSELVLAGGRRARHVLARARRAFEEAEPGVRVSAVRLPRLLGRMRSSDVRAFARARVPAVVVTDVAPIWPSSSHGRSNDVADRLDYTRLGCISVALAAVTRTLAASG